MKKNLIILSLGALLLSATRPTPSLTTLKEVVISDPNRVGATPRFSIDHRGNPVLTWVEKDGEKAAFYMATSTDGGQTFGQKVQIPVPANISVHAEGMPKLAFKADGTILALFEVPNPTPESRFAGDLLYMVSSGKTWTTPKPVQRDLTPGKSHSFSDLTRLPNGEIGIVWLDDKMPGKEGRSVRFTQTLPGGGFGSEVIVDDNACQCCRTNVFVDAKNQIHLTYRDMLDKVGSEPGARDISHVVSTDMGRTFTTPQVVVADGWKINACPHTGPELAQVGTDVFATWFSGKEGAVGLRLAKIGDPKLVSALYSDRAKHPQLATLRNQLVWVWDESVRQPNQSVDEPMPAYVQRIALRLGSAAETTFLTPNDVNATYPVVLSTKRGLLLAYEAKKGDAAPVITYQLLEP